MLVESDIRMLSGRSGIGVTSWTVVWVMFVVILSSDCRRSDVLFHYPVGPTACPNPFL